MEKIFQSAQSLKLKVDNFRILQTTRKQNSSPLLKDFKCPTILKNNQILINPIYVKFKNGNCCIVCDNKFEDNELMSQLVEKQEDDKNDIWNLCIQHNNDLKKSILIFINF